MIIYHSIILLFCIKSYLYYILHEYQSCQSRLIYWDPIKFIANTNKSSKTHVGKSNIKTLSSKW